MPTKHILIVEDDILNRRLYKKVLIENHYNVREAPNSLEANKILDSEPVDLVILDIHLGENEIDGVSLGRLIRDKYHKPFIYLTANQTKDIINEVDITTPSSYLTKPFKNEEFLASIVVAMHQYQPASKSEQTVTVKDGEYTLELALELIDYIESAGNYLMYYANNKIYKSRNTIKGILEILPSDMFIQTHRAFIVNKNKITKHNGKQLIVNGHVVPISKTFLQSQVEQLAS
ncbi:MAG TPA: response regulator transcription factor [Flavobacteriales bacterium]